MSSFFSLPLLIPNKRSDMKAEVKEKYQKVNTKYPCLKKSGAGLVFLFIAKNTAMCLSDSNIGEYRDTWNESAFVNFNDTITLSND